jgi:ribosome maturation factor RimP
VARQDPAGGAAATAVRAALARVVERLGLVLEDVTVTPAGSRRLLRVVVDTPADPADSADPAAPADADHAETAAEQGLSLDAVAEASREISAVLDDGDVMGSTPYVLEVSSPGVDRPLTERRHFRRNVRRTVEVTLTDGSTVTGRVTAAGDRLELAVPGAKKGMPASARELAWDDVVRGQVQVEFKALESGA